MTRKSITTSHAAVACDVCGRTLLRGEHADAFIAGGSRRTVCELCTARAANEGWIREGVDDGLAVRGNGGARGRSFLGRLRQRREAGEERAARTARRHTAGHVTPPTRTDEDLFAEAATRERLDDGWADAPAEDAWELEPPGGAVDGVVDEVPAPVPAPAPAPRAYEPPREPRHVRAVPTNADMKISRAVDLFNASRHPRTVGGVARSLGAPVVAVRPSSTEGAIVSIVVAWELCWYRYEVDLADEAAGVRVCGQGAELDELDADEQVPNAAADERGALVLAA